MQTKLTCTRQRVGVTMIGLTNMNCVHGFEFGNLNVQHAPKAICIHEFSISTKCPKPPLVATPQLKKYQNELVMNSVGFTKSDVCCTHGYKIYRCLHYYTYI